MSEEQNARPTKKRNMKVYYGHYALKYHRTTRHPMIQLRGNYLADFGFNVGDTIEVSVDTGQITIKKVKKPP